MEIKDIIEVIEQLADGLEPGTGEALPADGPMQEVTAARALHGALHILREQARKPPNAGRPWKVEDEARLAAGHAAGKEPAELARVVGRSKGSVLARLVKLGLVDASAATGLRYPV